MKRRDMLIKTLAAGALLTIPKPLQMFANEKKNAVLTEVLGTGNPLRFPPVFTNGGSMTLAETTEQVWPGQDTQLVTINGSYPGPSVVIDKGQTFTANVINNLNEVITTHWHGVSAPANMDGHPRDAINPGSSFIYTFPVINRGGTYFYHAHADMLTAKQVYRGFAGFFIVRDPAENYNLPSGAYDVPLCIQDRRTADIPNFTYNPGSPEQTWGYLGDTVLVNGTPDAYFEVGRTLYRFRLLNGSNARVYKIAFSDNRSFSIIATDGGLKDAPVTATQFNLAPGERVEILVDFSSNTIGQNVTLRSLAYTFGGTLPYKQGIALDIIRFDVTNNNTSGGTVPSAFDPISYYDPSEVVTSRTFTLTMGGTHPMHKINGLTFDINRIDWETRLHSLEKWRIINQTADYHPMHTHEAQWQVLSRNNNTNLPPTDKGWKDTVNLSPGETVEVLVKFTDHKGLYLFHCHNLEHEDDGMMLNFEIIDPIGIQQIGTEVPRSFELHQNYPNPFNPSTKIKFDIAERVADNASLKIFDVRGRQVADLYKGSISAGSYEADWKPDFMPSGTYFARLTAGNFTKTIKLVLAK
ncbi:MAG TPA: multicopper oxidase domain-containing protein [Ignavibacteria bacterium]|nr:multicopper oxidase domain-containing protein [Ignavibacteria bacterium]